MKQALADATQRNVWVNTADQIGSGVIIQTGIVLTNFHILEVDSDIFVDGKEAEVIAVWPKGDLILLRVHTRKVAPLQYTLKPEIGEDVFYVGNPNRHQDYTSFGRITYLDDYFVYTDTTGVGGASGSGLYNDQGELVGLTVAQEKNVITLHIRTRTILIFLQAHKELLK